LEFFAWLDADEHRYLALSDGALLVVIAFAIAGAWSAKMDVRLATRRGATMFLGYVLFALLAARWPTFFVRHRLNPDEAQMTAQAITAFHDPIPWLGFDGGTSGPFNTYVLMLPALVGAHVSFMTTRIVAVLLEFVAISALYVAARVVCGTAVARLAVVPPTIFWAISTQDDFVHYSSEHLSIALASCALALLALAWRDGYPLRGLFAVGAIVGVLPFAKLQSVPMAEALVAVAVALLLFEPRGTPIGTRRRRVAALATGCASVPVLLLLVLALAGSLRDFWNSYIITALAYSIGQNMPVSFLTQSAEIGPYVDWLCVVIVLGLGALAFVALRTRTIRAIDVVPLAVALVVFGGAIDAIYSPHHASPHYLLFAVVPTAGAAAVALALLSRTLAPNAGLRRGALALAFVVTCVIAQGALVRPHENWLGYDFYDYQNGGPQDPLAASIGNALRPGERLAIWGWFPEYWVFSDTLLGTRDSVSVFQFEPLFNPCRDYFRARYIADFQRVRPRGFLDAGSESFDFEGLTRHGYEEFPELAALIHRDYVLAGRWKRFRFFVRRD
jgi:hypothetical protein